ncbi:MAG: hypothetical protein ABEJ74_07120 [Haloferacaceae archaeon]
MLVGAVLVGAVLVDAVFVGAVLVSAVFVGAVLVSAVFVVDRGQPLHAEPRIAGLPPIESSFERIDPRQGGVGPALDVAVDGADAADEAAKGLGRGLEVLDALADVLQGLLHGVESTRQFRGVPEVGDGGLLVGQRPFHGIETCGEVTPRARAVAWLGSLAVAVCGVGALGSWHRDVWPRHPP